MKTTSAAMAAGLPKHRSIQVCLTANACFIASSLHPKMRQYHGCYVLSTLTKIKVQFVPPPRITLEYMCRCRTRQRALPPKADIRGIPAAPGSRTEVVSEVGRIAVQTPPRAVATPLGIVCSPPPPDAESSPTVKFWILQNSSLLHLRPTDPSSVRLRMAWKIYQEGIFAR